MKKGELKKPATKKLVVKPVVSNKLHLSHKYLFFFFIAVFVIIVSIPFLVWGGGALNQYRINHGLSFEIVSVFNNKTYTVTNNSDKDYLIPNKTATEINSFAGHLPPNVTMTENALPPLNCNDAGFVCGHICTYNSYDYETVKIGTQCWFNEDLRTLVNASGTLIALWPLGNSIPEPYNRYSTEANSPYEEIYYQWAAALPNDGVPANSNLEGVRGICPAGWRIPSDTDFNNFRNIVAQNDCYNPDYPSCFSGSCLHSNYNFNADYKGLRRNFVGNQWYDVGANLYIMNSTYDQTSNPHWSTRPIQILNDSALCQSGGSEEATAVSVRCIKTDGAANQD